MCADKAEKNCWVTLFSFVLVVTIHRFRHTVRCHILVFTRSTMLYGALVHLGKALPKATKPEASQFSRRDSPNLQSSQGRVSKARGRFCAGHTYQLFNYTINCLITQLTAMNEGYAASCMSSSNFSCIFSRFRCKILACKNLSQKAASWPTSNVLSKSIAACSAFRVASRIFFRTMPGAYWLRPYYSPLLKATWDTHTGMPGVPLPVILLSYEYCSCARSMCQMGITFLG